MMSTPCIALVALAFYLKHTNICINIKQTEDVKYDFKILVFELSGIAPFMLHQHLQAMLVRHFMSCLKLFGIHL